MCFRHIIKCVLRPRAVRSDEVVLPQTVEDDEFVFRHLYIKCELRDLHGLGDLIYSYYAC